MSTMMKGGGCSAFGKPLVIEDVPMPVPGPGEILVEVKACGVCHTDLHAASGDWPVKPAPPFIPGHEAAGVVAALGTDVTDFKLGDAVGVAWLHDACMRCEYCETGWETLCEHQHNTGYSVNGGFAHMWLRRLPLPRDCLPAWTSPPSRRSCAQRN
jgi:alcohol dehydrogenase, propanol-preferring